MQQLKSGSLLQGGKYRIEKVLGQGGFGITYLATQELLDRKVCIKEFFFKEYCERDEASSHVTLGTQSNHELVERFMNKFIKEARTISQLDHRNIIKIHDIFKENNTAYYVMDYVEGESLNDMVNRRGALPEKEAVAYIERVADALKYIHGKNINHLDVKPSNIMIRKGDLRVILIDFGLSKQYDAQGGQTSTTPVGISHGYAPMEQYNAGGVSTFSPQTDIYALGATLYKLVTGNKPPQAMEILNEGLPELPIHLSLNVKNAINKAMQIRKKDRPNDVKAFIELIDTSNFVGANFETNHTQPQSKEVKDETTTFLNKEISTEIINGGEEKNGFSLKLFFYIAAVYLLVTLVELSLISPYAYYFFCFVSLIAVLFLSKELRLYNEKNNKIQHPIVRILFPLLLAISLFCCIEVIPKGLSLSHEYALLFYYSSFLLIPFGITQLLVWEKRGIWTILLGLVMVLFDEEYFSIHFVLFFCLICLLLLLCIKKDGVNSWEQMQSGVPFKKHKLLYLLFIISFFGVYCMIYCFRYWIEFYIVYLL